MPRYFTEFMLGTVYQAPIYSSCHNSIHAGFSMKKAKNIFFNINTKREFVNVFYTAEVSSLS